jgi:hypothetical protein
MSALSQKQTLHRSNLMSALLPKADIRLSHWDVRFVPKAEVTVIRSVELIVQPDAKDGVGEMAVRGDLAPGPQPRR